MVEVPPLAAAHAATHALWRAARAPRAASRGARGERGPEEREGQRREGLRRGGAPRRSDVRRPSTSPNLADPVRFRPPKAPASRKFQPLRMLTNPLRKKAPEQAP